MPRRSHQSPANRAIILASATDRLGAARAVADAAGRIDLCVVSPCAAARETAAFAVGGRSVFTVEEPLLARCALPESAAGLLARVAQACRAIRAIDARFPLIVCARLDILGASAFILDERGLLRLVDDLRTASVRSIGRTNGC